MRGGWWPASVCASAAAAAVAASAAGETDGLHPRLLRTDDVHSAKLRTGRNTRGRDSLPAYGARNLLEIVRGWCGLGLPHPKQRRFWLGCISETGSPTNAFLQGEFSTTAQRRIETHVVTAFSVNMDSHSWFFP